MLPEIWSVVKIIAIKIAIVYNYYINFYVEYFLIFKRMILTRHF